MRKMSELWELVLEEYLENHKDRFGLCNATEMIVTTRDEREFLHHDRFLNKPRNSSWYYWPVEDSESRINFIKERIAHHKQIENN